MVLDGDACVIDRLFPTYDVAKDGRILMTKEPYQGRQEWDLFMARNWLVELSEQVPVP